VPSQYRHHKSRGLQHIHVLQETSHIVSDCLTTTTTLNEVVNMHHVSDNHVSETFLRCGDCCKSAPRICRRPFGSAAASRKTRTSSCTDSG